MKIRHSIYCFLFLLLLDVCLFGALLESGDRLITMDRGGLKEASASGDIPPMVALTFDDGPDRVYTAKLLDGLAERGVKATFFLVGENIEGNEDLVQRMDKEGHIIGNHTYSHIMLSKEKMEVDFEEIEQTNQKIYEVTGKIPTYIRAPFGARNRELEKEIDMEMILWDVDPEDWKYQNKKRIVNHVMKHVKDNDIVLLHDIFDTSVEAVLEIIDRLQADGWQFVTVDDLMPEGKASLE